MDIIKSKNPLNDVYAGLQKQSGNPVDFKMHETKRMPEIQYTTVVKGKEGRSSPMSGTALTSGVDMGMTDQESEAARNRAMKQAKAGV